MRMTKRKTTKTWSNGGGKGEEGGDAHKRRTDELDEEQGAGGIGDEDDGVHDDRGEPHGYQYGCYWPNDGGGDDDVQPQPYRNQKPNRQHSTTTQSNC